MPILILVFALFSAHIFHAQKINVPILEKIKLRALETHTDALIIAQEGNILYESFSATPEKPIYIASAGKSLVSLAIGHLLLQGQLDSLDQPVHTLFPEWKQGQKKMITLRMLLNHTSGLQDYANASIELEPPPTYQVANVIDLALAAELSHTPGTNLFYSNKATALLAGVVEKASGKRFDHFFVDAFYKPMDIANYEWIQDGQGNPTTHGAFVIKPTDLMKFGQLILRRGVYNGKRLVSEDWITESLAQGQEFSPIWGLLWWRLPEYEQRIIDREIWNSWRQAGVSERFLGKVKPLKDVVFDSRAAFYQALRQVFGEGWNTILNTELPETVDWSKKRFGPRILAYYAEGYRGNYLVIIPEKQLVAVRCADPTDFNYETDSFADFVTLVAQLSD